MTQPYANHDGELFGNGVYCTVQELFFAGMKAKDLDLHRLMNANSISAGGKRSRIRGRGMEYFESRPYVPLDEMRTIDWKVSARFSKLFTKVFIEERDRPIYCVVDLRPSMFFGSKRCFKSVLAARLAARISVAALHGGDQICGMTFDARKDQGGLGHGKKHLAHWFGRIAEGTVALYDERQQEMLDWRAVLSRLANQCRPGALVFLLSDFLDMDQSLKPLLFRIRKKAQIFAMAMIDPLEESIPAIGRVGMSFGNERLLFDSNDAALTKKYASVWRDGQAAIRDLFGSIDIPYVPCKTDEEPDVALRALLFGQGRGQR